MPEHGMPLDEAMQRSRVHLFLEVARLSVVATSLTILWSYRDGAIAPLHALTLAATGLVLFFGLIYLLQVSAKAAELSRLIREFDYRLDRQQFQPAQFGNQLVDGHFANVFKRMREERDAGIR